MIMVNVNINNIKYFIKYIFVGLFLIHTELGSNCILVLQF